MTVSLSKYFRILDMEVITREGFADVPNPNRRGGSDGLLIVRREVRANARLVAKRGIRKFNPLLPPHIVTAARRPWYLLHMQFDGKVFNVELLLVPPDERRST